MTVSSPFSLAGLTHETKFDTCAIAAEELASLVARHGLISQQQGLGSSSSRIGEFELLAKTGMDCLLSLEDDLPEAAELAYAVDELITAVVFRDSLEVAHDNIT